MPDKTYEYEGDGPAKPHKDVEITDLRHKRELEEEEGEREEKSPGKPDKPARSKEPDEEKREEGKREPEKPAEKPAPPAEEKPAAAAPPPLELDQEAEIEEEIGRPDSGEHHHAPGEEEMAAAEMEQLRMIFGAGLSAYLHSQLGLLLNFAMINLGRAPNPATGIVSTDLDKARLAIDLMEFVVNRIQNELPAEERAGAVKIIGELKYVYMQLVTNAGPAPSGEPLA